MSKSAKMPRVDISYEDMDKLIELVRRNPVLYDPTNKDYKDSTHIESAWTRIAKLMGRKNMSGSEWRKKWVNRRDTYVKKRRQIRIHLSPTAVERAKRWRFFDAMSFLDRFLEGSIDSAEYALSATNEDDSSETMSGDEEADDSTNIPFHLKSDVRKRPAPSPSPYGPTPSKKKPPDPDSSNGLYSTMPVVPCTVTFNGGGEAVDEIVHSSNINNTVADQMMEPPLADRYHYQYPQSPPSTRVTSPDYHLLFQSYAHRLERLPERTQSFIQLQIAQLFFNAENPDLPPMAIMPLPSSSSILVAPSSSSSSSSSSFCQQQRRRPADLLHDRQQQQHQQTLIPQDADVNNSESQQSETCLDCEIDDNCRTTCASYIKIENT